MVNSSHEQRHSKRPRLQSAQDDLVSIRLARRQWHQAVECTNHASLLLISSLSEPECEVADCLGARLDLDRLVIGEGVVLQGQPSPSGFLVESNFTSECIVYRPDKPCAVLLT